ncbi:MAG: C13 family peptidase, partial [Pseudomonadota bacterium]
MKKIQRLRNRLLPILFGFLSVSAVPAADLTFSPQNPQVEIGGKITVSGTSGAVTCENAVWKVFSDRNNVTALVLSEEEETLWVGTSSGLEQRNGATGELVRVFTHLDGLPNNSVRVLEIDGSGGLWIATGRGDLAHLSFSQKNTLCSDLSDEQCQNILTSKRAAIIIAGGSTDDSNTLWDSTAAISNYIYKMLNKRGFDNNEIYYLSPQSYADFNGDKLDDCIVDAPATPRCRLTTVENPIAERSLNVDDVRQAFAYAKTKGQLEQPLYVFFTNHGGTDRFQLSKDIYLYVDEFKSILDDYKNETGNELALVIDASYSGALLQKLVGPNRAIISSTGEGLAYFDRTNKQGFSRFGLDKGYLIV